MSLTLLVENNPKIESFYMLNLSTWLGLDVITNSKGDDALQTLEKDQDKIKLIIVRAIIDKDEAAKRIIEHVQKNNLKIPVIEIGPGPEVPGAFAHVANSLQLKVLIQSCAKALNITAKDMAEKVVPNYFPIPIQYFKVLKRSVCDVYLKDPGSADKYDLHIPKLTDFDEKFIDSLIDEKVTHLYVDKYDRLNFASNVTNELMSSLESTEVSLDEEISVADKSMELLSQKLLSIGVHEETIKIAKKSMQVMRKNVRINPKLSKLLERLLSNQSSYLFRHTQILTYVGLHIIKNIDWGNEEQEEKVAFISFFHDIVLEDDAQAKINSTLELKKSNLDPAKKTLVEKHAQMAAEFVTKFPHAPMGADQIIRQHHGQLNGVGFSEHFGSNVSPMSVVFIVAEEMTRIIIAQGTGPFNKAEMIKSLREKFPTSRFTKVIDLLETITF